MEKKEKKVIDVKELLLWVTKTDPELLPDLVDFMTGSDHVASVTTMILAVGFRAGRAYGFEEAKREAELPGKEPEPTDQD